MTIALHVNTHVRNKKVKIKTTKHNVQTIHNVQRDSLYQTMQIDIERETTRVIQGAPKKVTP